jgi:hypothetical protein
MTRMASGSQPYTRSLLYDLCRRRDDLSVNLIEERLQVLGSPGDERGQRPRRDRSAKPVRHQPSRPNIRKVLVAHQIKAQRPHPRPVLRRRADRDRGTPPSSHARTRSGAYARGAHWSATGSPADRTPDGRDAQHRDRLKDLPHNPRRPTGRDRRSRPGQRPSPDAHPDGRPGHQACDPTGAANSSAAAWTDHQRTATATSSASSAQADAPDR